MTQNLTFESKILFKIFFFWLEELKIIQKRLFESKKYFRIKFFGSKKTQKDTVTHRCVSSCAAGASGTLARFLSVLCLCKSDIVMTHSHCFFLTCLFSLFFLHISSFFVSFICFYFLHFIFFVFSLFDSDFFKILPAAICWNFEVKGDEGRLALCQCHGPCS